MKRKWILGILVFVLLCGCIPLDYAYAKENQEKLIVDINDFFISERTVVDVTYVNRKEGEELSVFSNHKEIVQVKLGKWFEDKKSIVLIPKKNGIATITVTGPNKEKLEITVHVNLKSERSIYDIQQSCSKAMVELVTYDSIGTESVGSGFFINSNTILTNYHVIEYANDMIVRDYDGNVYEAEYLYDYNKWADLAIIGVKESSDNALIFSNSKIETGQEVYSLGTPLDLPGTITEGIISKAYRLNDGVMNHQHTAYISQNSGGGPLLNCYGEVVGINVSRIVAAQNVYFAVDTSYVNLLDYSKKRPIKELYEENKDKIKVITIYVTLP